MTEPSQYFKGRTVQEQMNEVIGYVDTRAAEVATTAIASDVAQVHQDMVEAHASANAAAASAAAAAGTLANAVKKSGEASQSIAGDITIFGDLDVGGDADVTGALDVTGAITGNDASLIGTVTVPTEATGTFTTKSANSTKVKNELDNYQYMVRTTDNQVVDGQKTGKYRWLTNTSDIQSANTGWHKMYEVPLTNNIRTIVIEVLDRTNSKYGVVKIAARNFTPQISQLFGDLGSTIKFSVSTDATTGIIWYNGNRCTMNVRVFTYSFNDAIIFGEMTVPADIDSIFPEPVTPDYTYVVSL